MEFCTIRQILVHYILSVLNRSFFHQKYKSLRKILTLLISTIVLTLSTNPIYAQFVSGGGGGGGGGSNDLADPMNISAYGGTSDGSSDTGGAPTFHSSASSKPGQHGSSGGNAGIGGGGGGGGHNQGINGGNGDYSGGGGSDGSTPHTDNGKSKQNGDMYGGMGSNWARNRGGSATADYRTSATFTTPKNNSNAKVISDFDQGGGGGGAALVITNDNARFTFNNGANFKGGNGSNGNGGGGGGAGLAVLSGVSLNISSTILGGHGGNAIESSEYGGSGGGGGSGVFLYDGSKIKLTNNASGLISGGHGGDSVTSRGGDGGNGIIANQGTIINYGKIQGGQGGKAPVSNGLDGAGILANGSDIVNSGVIKSNGNDAIKFKFNSTGYGGSVNNSGTISGVSGISSSDLGHLQITNSGKIIGTGINAIQLYNNNSRVTLKHGSTITGNIYVKGGVNNGLVLDNISGESDVFASQITGNGFNSLTKTGAGVWTISDVYSGSSTVNVNAGTLILSAANTYTGQTTVNSGATLKSGVTNTLVNSAGVTIDGTWILNAAQTINNLSSNNMNAVINLKTSALTINEKVNTSFNGRIQGTGTLNKTGSGTLTLSGNNTYTGKTNVDSGTLLVTKAGTYSGGLDVKSGAKLQTDIESNIFAKNTENSNIDGTWQLLGNKAQTANKLSGKGVIDLGNTHLTALNRNAGSDDSIFSGVIKGAGTFTKSGNGTLNLSGNNEYLGLTNINQGQLILSGVSHSSGANIATGATLKIVDGGQIDSDMTNNGLLVFSNNNAFTYSGMIAGSGTLNKEGDDTLQLTGLNSHVGYVNVNNGHLKLLQQGDFSSDYFINNAEMTLDANSTLNINKTFTQKNTATLNVSLGGLTPTIKATNATLAGNLNISGFTLGSMDKASHLSTTTIIETTDGIEGEFTDYRGDAISPVNYLSVNSGKDSTGNLYQVGLGLTWFNNDNSAHGLFSLNAMDDRFDVDISLMNQDPVADIWDGSSLTKMGLGTLTLSGVNTYTGKTNVDEGTLLITKAGVYSGGLDVKFGATLQTDIESNIFSGNTQSSNINGTWALLGDQAQTANKLSGRGLINLGNATLTARNNELGIDDSTFAGQITGTGSFRKIGAGTLILTENSTYTGTTTIEAGILQLGDGGTSGGIKSSEIINNATLIVDRSNPYNYSGKISGEGHFIKRSAGALTFGGAISNIGRVDVDGGSLIFLNSGPFSVTHDYTTASGATTVIGEEASVIEIGGTFEQKDDSMLDVYLSSDPTKVLITASTAKLSGDLIIRGFDTNPANTASSIEGKSYVIIRTTDTPIIGDFTSGGFPSNNLDYLLDTGRIRGYEYIVGFELAWIDGKQSHGTGNFTLSEGTSFNIDIALQDQAIPTDGFNSGWDGQSLTKLGAGTLTLSSTDITYTGTTTVAEGTLVITAAGVGSYTGDLNVQEKGTLQTETAENIFINTPSTRIDGTWQLLGDKNQIANNLSGIGLIDINNGNLTANNKNRETDNTTFSGIVSGSGTFTKIGSGTLTLTGDNTYTGVTMIDEGTLEFGDGGSSGGMASDEIINNGTLIINRNDFSIYSGKISGDGNFIKKGAGTFAFDGAVSSIGRVDVNDGTLIFANTVPLKVRDDYITKADATTVIGENASVIEIGGTFEQKDNSYLDVYLSTDPTKALITASAAKLDGDLIIRGFDASATNTASTIIGKNYVIIRTTDTPISGNFTDDDPSDSTLDYLLDGGRIVDENEYIVGFVFAWTDGKQRYGTGDFTLSAGTSFDVDIALLDQAVPTDGFNSGWDGQSLTKLGAGTLTLSSSDITYTGTTTVAEGTLIVTAAGANSYTGDLNVQEEGVLQTDKTENIFANASSIRIDGTWQLLGEKQQTVNNLTGHGAIDVGGAVFRSNNDIDTDFSGVISGSGSFDKEGLGTLNLSGDNTYTGFTNINQGQLILSGFNNSRLTNIATNATLQVADGGHLNGDIINEGTLIFNHNDESTYAGTMNGDGTLIKQGADNLILTGSNSWLGETQINEGALILDGSSGGGQLTSTIIAQNKTQFILRHGATFNGKIDPVDMTIDSSSTWNLTDSSIVNRLEHAGTLVFVKNDLFSKTLTIEGDYLGTGGLFQINTMLEDDYSPSSSILIKGNSDGNARLEINQVGGLGAETENGIEVIHVEGESNALFEMQGRAVAGAYEYSLYQNNDDGNWYLSSQIATPPNPEPMPIYRPEVGAYLANQNAANSLFIQTFRERTSEDRDVSDRLNNKALNNSAWARVNSNIQNSEAANGQVNISAQNSIIQVGTDLIQWENEGSSIRGGIMFSGGQSNSTEQSNNNDAYARNELNGYAFGLYGTWYELGNGYNEGLYIDSWLQYGRYQNSVKGDYLPEQKYDSRNWLTSIEVGYTIALFKGPHNIWYIEPQIQAIYSDYDQEDITEANGTQVKAQNTNNWITRVGTRLYAKKTLNNGIDLKSFAEFNWLYNQNSATVSMNSSVGTSVIASDNPKDRFEIKFGLDAAFTKKWNIWGNASYQQGSHGYQQIGGDIGVKYRW